MYMRESLFVNPVRLLLILGSIILSACAGTPQYTATEAGPEWVYDVSAVYPANRYVAAVGYGLDRESAEKNALGSLVSVFGQTVRGDTQASYRYAEALAGGLIDTRESSEIENAVRTSYIHDTIIGAEVPNVWLDNKGTYYAVAVMDKLRGSLLYNDLIESNERTITALLNIPSGDRNSLDAYARYGLAATIADANTPFVNILTVLSPASASTLRDSLHKGADLRIAQREIVRNIPIQVTVKDDRSGRIAAAFAQVFANAGFQGGGSSRYVLEADLAIAEVDLSANQNKFVRYILNTQLRDNSTGQTLIPFNINGREGHTSVSEAENRALRAAENRIRDEYAAALTAYLEQLTPKK
ncbi:hypothetical protein FACS189493_5860 [Spirochaetia bacterium]|nr:hypothetical protein FACS189493_5860 [Spirochaetia bacterium]